MTNKSIIILKADGTKEEFNENKLSESLINAGAKTVSAEAIVDHIKSELEDGMSTREIYHHAFLMLHKLEKPVAIRYSLRRAIADLGPSGFPFEKFVAEIFKAKGYETMTDQLVRGACVEHEVDVVAWNDRELCMAEVKFHNEFGLKSDLKVALYVKARFDDLSVRKYNYGGIERKLDRGMLITNTKFSEMAINYAECKGLRLIGWNYPNKGSLQDMIIDCGLHPITSLTTLTVSEKEELIRNGIVLCQGIIANPKALDLINVKDGKAKSVLEEANVLCAESHSDWKI